MVLTSNLDQRYVLRKVIDCHHFESVTQPAYFVNRNICIWKIVRKVHVSHVIEPRMVSIISFPNGKSYSYLKYTLRENCSSTDQTYLDTISCSDIAVTYPGILWSNVHLQCGIRNMHQTGK